MRGSANQRLFPRTKFRLAHYHALSTVDTHSVKLLGLSVLIEVRRPSLGGPAFPSDFGGSRERGLTAAETPGWSALPRQQFSAEIAAGSRLRSGWGATLRAAHCHPLKRMERYREAKKLESVPSRIFLLYLHLPTS